MKCHFRTLRSTILCCIPSSHFYCIRGIRFSCLIECLWASLCFKGLTQQLPSKAFLTAKEIQVHKDIFRLAYFTESPSKQKWDQLWGWLIERPLSSPGGRRTVSKLCRHPLCCLRDRLSARPGLPWLPVPLPTVPHRATLLACKREINNLSFWGFLTVE